MSQAQKEKKNKPSPKKQVQGDHERIKKRPRRLEAQTKKHQEEKETHDKRLSSQDPQQPSRGADPSRRTVKRRLGQLERKGTLTFWRLHWGLGKEKGRSNPFTEHAFKTKKQQRN